MKTLGIILALVFSISIIPLVFASPLDESQILQNGFFNSESGKYLVSSELEIRESKNLSILRISGITVFGYPFYIIENTALQSVRGIVIGENGIEYVTSIDEPELDEISSESQNAESTEIHFLATHYDRVYVGMPYQFTVKTFDKSKYSGINFENFHGKIDGVSLTAKIKNSKGEILKEINGQTKFGVFSNSIIIPDNWPRGTYNVGLELEFDGQIYEKTLEFYVLGKLSDGATSIPPPIPPPEP